MLLNYGVGKDSWEPLGLQGYPTSLFQRKSILNIHRKDSCWCWNSNILATSCKELTHWKRPGCWERLLDSAYTVSLKVHGGFSLRCYRKAQMNFLTNLIFEKGERKGRDMKKVQHVSCCQLVSPFFILMRFKAPLMPVGKNIVQITCWRTLTNLVNSNPVYWVLTLLRWCWRVGRRRGWFGQLGRF